MSIERWRARYPKLFGKLDEDINALRYLLVIDENINDIDSDEFDAIDPEDYNYLVYITDRLQAVMDEGMMVAFLKALEAHEDVALFYMSEIDLYGIQTALDEEGIAQMVLGIIEGLFP